MSRSLRVASIAATVVATVAALATTSLTAAVAAPATVSAYRVAGADRVATAVQASQFVWDDAGTTDGAIAQAVVLSRHDQYADALGGSALAGAAGGPLLLTHTTSIDSITMNEVNRILGGEGIVYLLGGTGAISGQAQESLTKKGYSIVRLAGADRFETSVKVATEVGKFANGGHPQFIFATTGQNFPDGLAAGATAGGYTAAVVLTRDSLLPTSVKSYLIAERSAGTEIYAIGGASAKAPFNWTDALVGKDRYETAAELAKAFWGDGATTDDDPTALALATGENWPDALAGGALIASWGPLLLTQPTRFTTTTKSAVSAIVTAQDPRTVEVGVVLGGTAAVSDPVKNAFESVLNS
ncbi:MAG: cell wall-binding repeat-containing protein [Intrasporangium sp.]|uniref:cell wall-binding repeat-containing protein n=1 Tax=Intrasporangium sp. TaxID=1925024 RepID=UPI002647710F|nr:cell wall-binding repeat-containing protein [Intrasporangium sp.]MDN5798015.1 cell wall-binding repeat-containing protein [Intrasporangium sp.]